MHNNYVASRVLVQHLTSFETSKKSVVWHIASDYVQEMSTKSEVVSRITVLEITVGHWPFSNQFQHLADHNTFWSAIFHVHFQWNSNQ